MIKLQTNYLLQPEVLVFLSNVKKESILNKGD